MRRVGALGGFSSSSHSRYPDWHAPPTAHSHMQLAQACTTHHLPTHPLHTCEIVTSSRSLPMPYNNALSKTHCCSFLWWNHFKKKGVRRTSYVSMLKLSWWQDYITYQLIPAIENWNQAKHINIVSLIFWNLIRLYKIK